MQQQTIGNIEMIKLERSIVINRPVEKVFAFVSNVENTPQWVGDAVETKVTSEGPVGVGTTYSEVARFLGRRIESIYEVTEYEPNSKFASKITSGPVQFEIGFTFEAVERGTKVTGVGKAEPGGFFKLAEPVVARRVKRELESNLANLKNILEAQAEE